MQKQNHFIPLKGSPQDVGQEKILDDLMNGMYRPLIIAVPGCSDPLCACGGENTPKIITEKYPVLN